MSCGFTPSSVRTASVLLASSPSSGRFEEGAASLVRCGIKFLWYYDVVMPQKAYATKTRNDIGKRFDET
jgi:hypothetical protein